MLVFNEGIPGSGKSYDAIKTHILPALKKGRHVYARIDGLDHAKIATYLDMPETQIRGLLHHVPEAAVDKLHLSERRDCLAVVDEAHKFWPASREGLPPGQEDLFAEHRRRGWDIVLASQFYKRIHLAVRARIERKDVFRKMNMVGSEGSYVVKHYTALEPDKYEAIGTETRRYDKAIFPLYKSVMAGAENFEVYDAGAFTIWRKLGKWAILMVPLGLWAVWYIVGWFQHPHAFGKETKQPGVTQGAPAAKHSGPGRAADGTLEPNRKKGIDTSAFPPEAAYIFDLASQGRPRLAAIATMGDNHYGIVEFRDSQEHVTERITIAQLAALGLDLKFTGYGLRIGWKDAALIVTPWPLDMPGGVSQTQSEDIDSHPLRRGQLQEVASLPSVSEPDSQQSASVSSADLMRPGGTGQFRAGPTTIAAPVDPAPGQPQTPHQ